MAYSSPGLMKRPQTRMQWAEDVTIVRREDQAVIFQSTGEYALDGRATGDALEDLAAEIAEGRRTDWNDHDVQHNLYEALCELETLVQTDPPHESRRPLPPVDVSVEDGAKEAPTTLVVGATALAHACVAQLRATGQRVSWSRGWNALPRPPQPDNLVLDLTPFHAVMEHERIAQGVHEAGCRSLAAWFDRDELAIGPLAGPGLLGCARCRQRRRLASLPVEVSHVLGPGHTVLVEARRDLTHSDRVTAAAQILTRTVTSIGPEPTLWRLSPGSIHHHELSTGGLTAHRLVAEPWCPSCASGQDDRPATSVDALIDPVYGIVTDVRRQESELTGYHAVVADGALALDEDRAPRMHQADRSRGAQMHCEGARLAALGEAFERYAARRSPARLRMATATELAGDVLTATELMPYADDQYEALNLQQTKERSATEWLQGHWLHGSPVWVPAEHVFLGKREHRRTARITSNGLATGHDVNDAAGRAIGELIERDALMDTWIHRRAATVLTWSDLDPRTRELVSELHTRCEVRVRLWQLTAALPVPVVVAVAYGDGVRTSGMTLGAAADGSVERASRRAVLELTSNCEASKAELADGHLAPIADPQDVHDIDDHAAYYRDPAHADHLDFLGSETAPTDPPRPTDPVNLQELSRSEGLRIALVDVTPPDVAATGLTVVRALSPDLLPLWFGYNSEPLRHPRLHPRTALNRVPHPFR